MERNQRTFRCGMCLFQTVTEWRLLQHYVRRHHFDPRFRVTCTEGNCGASFQKWSSFKQHLKRKHRDRHLNLPENEDAGPEHANILLPENDDVLDNFAADVDPQDVVHLQAGRFLVHLRDVCNTSHTAIEAVMRGTEALIESYRNLLLGELRKVAENGDGYVSVEDLQRCANSCPISNVFAPVNTKYKLDGFMERRLNFITPVGIEMRKAWVWRRRPSPALIEKVFMGYRVPLLDNLKRMLRNYDVRFCVENPLPFNNFMTTVLHGKYYRNHPFFSANRNALAIILYYDELEIVNPLGSRTHKLGMFYWSLANIFPEFRSTLRAINLYAIARYTDIKKAGIGKILKEFAEEIQVLQREGITVEVRGVNKTYKGSLLMVAGDTPASAAVGGFKRSVSAKRPCRRCMTTQVRLKHYFREDDFEVRSQEKHLEQLEAICEPNITQLVRKFWKTEYGINERSELLSIEHFDVSKCLVQDTMHVISEGVLEVEMIQFLKYCISVKQFFSVATFNEKVENFNYQHFLSDKPSPLHSDHLENGRLRQSAAQMVCLAIVLPFLVSDMLVGDDGIEDGDGHAHLRCHIQLLQIVSFCFAFKFTEDDAYFLGNLIENFLVNFVELYTRDALVPKFHFLIHVVRQIIDFGPLRQQYCYRFEAANARHKFLARVVRCFKNMPWTLSYRDEARRCLQFSAEGEEQTRFLYQGHYIKPGKVMKLVEFNAMELLLPHIPGVNVNECEVMITSKIIAWGTTFKTGSVILVECTEAELPKFAKIQHIVVKEEEIFLVYREIKTIMYFQNLNAYHIEQRPERMVQHTIPIKNLSFHYPLSVFRFQRNDFIVLFHHTRTEFLH